MGVTKTRVVGKRVVRILLECCLVYLLCFAARHTPRQRCVVTYEILSPRGDGLPCSAKLHSPSSSRSSSPEKRDSCTRTGKDISLPAVWSIGEYWVDDICIAKEIPLSLCISVLTDNWSTFDNFCCFKKKYCPPNQKFERWGGHIWRYSDHFHAHNSAKCNVIILQLFRETCCQTCMFQV